MKLGSDTGSREPSRAAWRHFQNLARFPLLFLSLVYLVVSLSVYVVYPQEIHFFFPDDAFFYMKTAYNICAGLGVSFDGVNETNGFHPLYLLLLSGLSCVFPIVGNSGIQVVYLLDVFVAVVGLFFAARLSREADLSLPARWIFLAGLLPVAFNQDFGTEANLLVTLTWGFLYFSLKARDNWSGLLIAGQFAALACLSRIDTILLICLISLPIAFPSGTIGLASFPRAVLRMMLILLPSFLALGAVAAVSYNWFGHPSSISSSLKVGFRSVELAEGTPLFTLDSQRSLPFGAVAITAVCFSVAVLLRLFWERSRVNFIVAALGAWIVIYFLVMTLFLRGGMEAWYYSLPFSISVFVAVHFLQPFFMRVPTAIQVTASVLIVVIGISMTLILSSYWRSRTWATDDSIEISEWMKTNIPPHARIFQVDNSGITGYFSERTIVNGDGLVNNWEYQDSLRSGQLSDYLGRKGITYVLFDAYSAGKATRMTVKLWDAPALFMEFRGAPEIVKVVGRFVLYRVDPDQILTRPGDGRFH